ncbi:MAG: FAD-dependent oxidoreductase [Clostridia bacterium]|nr:FAD-dependent oxidoreductase [Clostridia bacterium]
MKIYDVGVLGGGVIGCEIARRLTDLSLKTALIEKCADVAEGGATKANSGIIHAGFDCKVGTKKAKFNVLGSKMYPEIAKRLGVEVKNVGAIVVGRENDLEKIKGLYNQGIANGVEGLEIIEREEIEKFLPTVNKEIKYALYAKTSSIVSPYQMAIAMAEEAALNGCDFYFESPVEKVEKVDGYYKLETKDGEILCKVVVNATGAGSAKVNQIFGAEKFDLRFARGEYCLLDLTERDFVKCTVFPLPSKLGKGVLVSPTVHGNVILGPTAIDCQADENVISQEGLDYLKNNVALVCDGVNYRKNIRVFAGNRVISGDDFIIEKSKLVDNYVYLGGICSPGLSSAPAIALEVARLVEECGLTLKQKESYIPRKPYTDTHALTKEEHNELIKKDGAYGKIVCRCEKITEGEILEAVRSPLRPKTVDGVKRRVRAGMGRCQGGFCMPTVMEIIAKENGLKLCDITKFGANSYIVLNKAEE